jgi:hypothetical protein
VGHRVRPALPGGIASERFPVNTSSHLFSFRLLNILMRENWKDMLFVFAVAALAFMVNYHVVSYRVAQRPSAAIQERGK